MSSAILYLAIVAIWAVVLIPQWLRRDSAAGGDLSAAEPDEEAVTPPARGEAVAEARFEAPAATRPAARAEAHMTARPAGRAAGRAEVPGAPRDAAPARPEAAPARPEAARARGEAPTPTPTRHDDARDLERKRVLASRRRLLGMLLILAAGSAALAVTAMAAWWVIVPPAVMLLGYLALLREAAKADAERREVARAAARAVPAAAAPERKAAAQPRASAAPARGVSATPAPARGGPAAPPARGGSAAAPVRGGSAAPPAPDAEVIDISASAGPAGQEFYDQYADAKLRAVGDLPRSLAA